MQVPVLTEKKLSEFRRPVQPQSLSKVLCVNDDDDYSGQKWSISGKSVGGHSSNVTHCGCKRSASADDLDLSSPAKKRKESESSEVGSRCPSSEFCSESNGCLVFLCRSADGKDSSDRESIYSIQSKVTEIVRDSSDDLWFLDEDAGSGSFSLDVYSDEFEVISSCELDTDSDADNILTSQEDVIVICEESDLECFADCEWSGIEDDSSDDDNLLQADKWFCSACEHMNGPLHRYCESCWTLRPNWLPRSSPRKCGPQDESKDKQDSRSSEGHKCQDVNPDDGYFIPYGPSASNKELSSEQCVVDLPATGNVSRQEMPSSQDSGFGSFPTDISSSSSQVQSILGEASAAASDKASPAVDGCTVVKENGLESSLQSPSTSTSISSPPSSCIICLSQPKEATIVHGSTGHQSCCYQCARRLKRCNRPCPVCRRDIQKVIRNYIV